MRINDYEIQKMTLEDLKTAVNWAAREGWNPGLHDAECFFEADDSGFFKGVIDGEMVSSISVVKYDAEFAFLGFYIVRPEYRGKGLGYSIWNESLKGMEGFCIGLDGVVAQQENYRKSGFRFAYKNTRFRGVSQGQNPTPVQTKDALQIPMDGVAEFDERFFPTERKGFLRKWLNHAATSRPYVEDGEIKGYGVLRKCLNGFKFGPLFAENGCIARIVFAEILDTIPAGEEFFLDVPEPNREGLSLVREYGMEPVFETARMYTNKMPDLPTEKIFGVTTFELG